MEIERINENTVKFYISYMDIEDRGFEREEIWYNRERSEQLFWQMMDEINYKEDFSVEGPLWIQVQALEKGLEIIVTKAQASKNGNHFEFPKIDDDSLDVTLEDKTDSLFENEFNNDIEELEKELDNNFDTKIWVITRFNDFEDVIQLSYKFNNLSSVTVDTSLFHYEEKYYLYVELSPDLFDEQEDVLSQIFEYAEEADMTIHYLEEYGKKVIESDVFKRIKENFPL